MTSRADHLALGSAGSPGFEWRRLAFWFVLTLLAICFFAASFAFGYSRMHEQTVLPGVQVAGIDLAGLNRRAAEVKLRETLPSLTTGTLTVRVGGLTDTIPYAEFDRDYDMDYMLGEAFTLGRDGTFVDQLGEQVALLQNGATIQPAVTWDSEKLALRVAELANAAQVPVVDATITRHDGHYVASPASDGLQIDVASVVSAAMAAINNLSAADAEVVIEGTTIVPAVSTEAAQAAVDRAERVVAGGLPLAGEDLAATIDPQILSGWVHLDQVAVGQWEVSIEPEPVSEYVANYAREVEVPATNATFSVGGGNIDVIPSALGRAVDVDPTAASVLGQLQARSDGQAGGAASISFVPIEPTLTTQEARDIAPRIKELGEWTTFYTPDPALNGNGVNIQIPTNILDGQVVEPGAQFDFLTAIGPIKSPPYETGGALVHGQIKEDSIIGGGMCSVSTTLFNAALRYGLPIWARDNHSLYISRYPVGLDATVWMTDKKNRQTMGFINDTGYPIVIRGINGPGSVTFQIWGIDDGRTVELTEPRVENTIKPEFMYVEYTNDLAPGRRVRVNDAYDAFDSWVTRTVRSQSGEILLEETYRSHYKQLPALVRVGRTDGDPHHGRVVKVRVPDGGPQPDPVPPEG